MDSRLPASSKLLFVSDAHLGAFTERKNRQTERALIQLIDFAEDQDYRLAILGDLFDYWIEYPSYIPQLGDVMLQRFERYNRNTGPALYITGNHDNWTIGHFQKIGFDVEPDARLLHIHDTSVMLMHGDAIGTSPDTLQRPLFHRIIRHPVFLKIYRGLLPPKAGISVMKYFSKVSRMIGEEQSDPDELNNTAEQLLSRNDIDMVLCGHDHRPRTLNFSYGSYINLGTFHAHRSLVEYNNGTFSLVEWNEKEMTLTPYNTNNHLHE